MFCTAYKKMNNRHSNYKQGIRQKLCYAFLIVKKCHVTLLSEKKAITI